MTLKTYRAASIADALSQIKRDLGADAVILHTRTFKNGGFLGFRARPMVEITASSGVNVVNPLARRPKAPAPRKPSAMLRRAYGVPDDAPLDTPPVESAATREPAPTPIAVAEPAPEAPMPQAEPGALPTAQPVRARSVPACEVTPVAVADSALSLQMSDEIASIKRLVGQVLQKSRGGAAQPTMPECLFERYLKLIESEVAADIADEVVGRVRDELSFDELNNDAVEHETVLRRLSAYVPVCDEAPRPGRCADGRPLTIALVGPTGVGKTTTIAKLAATYRLRYNRKVGLLTCDTYRIAAVDQLRTYANIMGVPLRVAQSAAEVEAACEAFADFDAVLIDTAGRSQHDAPRLDELRALLEAARPHETHLVLSGAASESVLLKAAERFRPLGPNRVIFTKLDETVSFGVLVNAARRIGAGLSFVTTGQEVPDHIEPGRADRLARLVLDGGFAR
ncbi:MAG: flagellar biosynthesis protein FlhF [Phycisphaerales bacterium]